MSSSARANGSAIRGSAAKSSAAGASVSGTSVRRHRDRAQLDRARAIAVRVDGVRGDAVTDGKLTLVAVEHVQRRQLGAIDLRNERLVDEPAAGEHRRAIERRAPRALPGTATPRRRRAAARTGC